MKHKFCYTADKAANIILKELPLGDISNLSDYSDDEENFELDRLQAEQYCKADSYIKQVEEDVSEY